MNVAINLLWLRPKSMGGVEYYIKNLIKGINNNEDGIRFIILINRLAKNYFSDIPLSDKILIKPFNINPYNKLRMLLYQFMFMKHILKEFDQDIAVLFHPTPIYPINKIKNIKQVVAIHDLQYLNFPRFANCLKRWKYYWSWRNSIKNSDMVITVSSFTKEDVIRHFGVGENKIAVIYNPIGLPDQSEKFSIISSKYNIKRREYFYTISSLGPNKNTFTIIKLMYLIKTNQEKGLPSKLLISGMSKIRGTKEETLIRQFNLEKDVIFTGFVSESEKRSLIENCYCFLFPSIYEGFGIPPVETIMLGCPVITTRGGALEEVTKGLAIYVKDPFDELEWLRAIKEKICLYIGPEKEKRVQELRSMYCPRRIANEYKKVFNDIINK